MIDPVREKEFNPMGLCETCQREEHWRIERIISAKPRAKQRQANHKRKAQMMEQRYDFTLEEWEACKNEFDNRCAYCGKKLNLIQEHVIPVSKNGAYTAGNILPSCYRCNNEKRSQTFEEWYPNSKRYSKDREHKIINYLKKFK
jgi:5-methylcytosine-specific restriction endonuclease McrA